MQQICPQETNGTDEEGVLAQKGVLPSNAYQNNVLVRTPDTCIVNAKVLVWALTPLLPSPILSILPQPFYFLTLRLPMCLLINVETHAPARDAAMSLITSFDVYSLM
jgi:hypothetical protein